MGVRITLQSVPTETNFMSGLWATGTATASQPRRNGPVLVTAQPITLKDRIRRAFMYGSQTQRVGDLALAFGASHDSISATIRDLRKEGLDIAYDYNSSLYNYTPFGQQANAAEQNRRWA